MGNAVAARRISGAAVPQDGGTDKPPPIDAASPIPAETAPVPRPAEADTSAAEPKEPATVDPAAAPSAGAAAAAVAADTNGAWAALIIGSMTYPTPEPRNVVPPNKLSQPVVCVLIVS